MSWADGNGFAPRSSAPATQDWKKESQKDQPEPLVSIDQLMKKTRTGNSCYVMQEIRALALADLTAALTELNFHLARPEPLDGHQWRLELTAAVDCSPPGSDNTMT